MRKVTVALVGNPNSGKSTIFNRLTGANQHVGNYPGVTVDIKHGSFRHGGHEIDVIDLPGIYSLTAHSLDEIVARDFIIEEKPDVIVNVIDASNLERNLYLTVELIEMGGSIIVFDFNMSDEARAKGDSFDLEEFSRLLNGYVVETVGNKGIGIKELKDAIVDAAEKRGLNKNLSLISYGETLEKEIERIKSILEKNRCRDERLDSRWLSIKLLENDVEIIKKIDCYEMAKEIEKSRCRVEESTGKLPEVVIAEKRYSFISEMCKKAVHPKTEVKQTLTERIDKIVMNRILGIPLFLCLTYLMFALVFTIGEIPAGWIESFFGWIKNAANEIWAGKSESLLRSLILDGLIGGTGSVLVFLPNILLLFFCISVLEDTGYMARAAFIMDRFMNRMGLHGKSFIPMLLGFGCSIPAILATRTIGNRKDRLITMLIIPLMSCSARLAIYTLIIPAFFPKNLYAPMLLTIYLTGIAVAVAGAKILTRTAFKGESAPFIMELPPYRVPTLRDALIHMWQRSYMYLKRAGTVILSISILLWALSSFPSIPEQKKEYFENLKREISTSKLLSEKDKAERLKSVENEEKALKVSNSISGRLGKALEPILQPMGFDWKIGTALIGAFAAREVFVAQLGIVYSLGGEENALETLRERLQEDYTRLTGFCIMLFCLISMPCMATVATMKKESGSWRWAIIQLLGLTIIGYVVTITTYQIGRFLGLGTARG